MYTLIIDGDVKSIENSFKSWGIALYWYNSAKKNGANSAALWRDQSLLKSFVKGE